MVGQVSGTVNATWVGSPANVVAQLDLESSPPGNPLPHQVPVTARLQATYHGATESIDVTGLSLATRNMRLNATGTLGSSRAQLQVGFNADDLRELKPVLNGQGIKILSTSRGVVSDREARQRRLGGEVLCELY